MLVIALLVVLLVIGGIHLYLWARLVRASTTSKRVRRIGAAVFVVLALLPIAALLLRRSAPMSLGAVVGWPGNLWLALMFYLLVALLLLELPRLAVRLSGWAGGRRGRPVDPGRRLVLARGAAAIAGVSAAALVGYGAKTALSGPQVRRVPVPLRALAPAGSGLRVAAVSDIHLGPLLGRSHTERIVRTINELEPDVIAIVGDMVDGTVAELGDAAAPLRDLVATHGAYFVTGNHEYFTDAQEWIREVDRLGVRPLRNERVEIRHRGATLDLAGVNDLNGRESGDGPDFAAALGNRPAGRPVVLLSHQPVTVTEAAPFGVDLQISGHTHGGQLYPFDYIVGIEQPVISGLAEVQGVPIYVTSGAGFWGPPVRVGAPPEVTLLELRSPPS